MAQWMAAEWGEMIDTTQRSLSDGFGLLAFSKRSMRLALWMTCGLSGVGDNSSSTALGHAGFSEPLDWKHDQWRLDFICSLGALSVLQPRR